MKRLFVFFILFFILISLISAQEDSYKVLFNQKAKLFGIFPITEKGEIEVNSETGDISSINKPWWGFLAKNLKLSDNNIEFIAKKMLESYNNINTVQFHFEQTGFEKNDSPASLFITNEYLDKVKNKKKIEFLSVEGKVANLWIGENYYDIREDKIYKYSCPSNVFDAPDFVAELKSMMRKWGSIELVGVETIKDSETYKIQLGEEGHYIWIDQIYYLPVKEFFGENYERNYSNYIINGNFSESVFSVPSGISIIEKGCDEEGIVEPCIPSENIHCITA